MHWLAGIASLLLSLSAFADPVRFAVIGDTPYTRYERQELPKLLHALEEEPVDFVVHVGDIKSGGEPCSDALFADRFQLFNQQAHPFVLVPGDNEWTDCHRPACGGYDPQERLEALRHVFFANPEHSLGQQKINIFSQSTSLQYREFKENLRWTLSATDKKIVFISLNLPGSNNDRGNSVQPTAAYQHRASANAQWLADGFSEAAQQHASAVVIFIQANPGFEAYARGQASSGYQAFLDQLYALSQAFSGHVLLVHGDTHWQHLDQPFRRPGEAQPLRNFTRLESFGSPFMGWVTVSFSDQPARFGESPFRFRSVSWPPASKD